MIPLYNSDSHSTHPNVRNEQLFLSRTKCLRRISFSSDTLHLFGSRLSGKPSSSCMFSPIHSANLVGKNCNTGWLLRYAYSSHTLSGACSRHTLALPKSDAAPATLNGFKRSISRFTAPAVRFPSAWTGDCQIDIVYIRYNYGINYNNTEILMNCCSRLHIVS
jgi:hypothetical protein